MTDGADLVAAVDIGGTKVPAALVDADHVVVARTRARTPATGPDGVVAAVAGMLAELGGEPVAVGVAAPGPIGDGGLVRVAPNLVGWDRPVRLGALLDDALGRGGAVVNDCTAGTVGEWVAGAAAGASDVLGVFMGTGVGGGLVLAGRPHVGATGGAGEIGHMTVRAGGALCGCGRRGCVEAYAGRGAMEVAARTLGSPGLIEALAENGKDRMTAGVWAKALGGGDAVAWRILDEAVAAVGLGIASAVNLLDIGLVVIGGGLAQKLGQDLADRIAAAVRPMLLVPDLPLRVVASALGDDAAVVGCAHLARVG